MPEPTQPGAAGQDLDNLAGQALENLVNQFARPLDFLRELVQNAIDAGTPRVEVRIGFVPDDSSASDAAASDAAASDAAASDADADAAAATGVLEIHVDDFGEGMDERIIDTQLTRLFASTKEDDLTKIGKFGIGFTSIFAIRPDAVLLRTGRHGESWELLFHADRTFDKVRIDQPVAGTKITLFKRMPAAEVSHFVRESRWILRFWCEHSNTPITFWDRTRPEQVAPVETADPFAAFAEPAAPPASADAASADAQSADAGDTDDAAPAGPEAINSPMDLDADLSVRGEHDGVKVVVGYAPRPRYGFYNGGLTLMNTENDDVLGDWMHRLGHLSFKVKSDALEHTLTRDNVLQDDNWERAINALEHCSRDLQRALVERTAAAVAAGEPLSTWHRHLSQECRARALHKTLPLARTAPLLRDFRGRGVSLDELEAADREQGAVLLHPGPGPLADALEAEGVLMFDDDPDLRELLVATWRPPFFAMSVKGRRIVRADTLYLLPRLVPGAELDRREARLLQATRDLLAHSVDGRLDLQLAEFPGGADEALVVEGPEDTGVFRRSGRRWRWLPGILHRRRLLLNRNHPYTLGQVVLAGERPAVAAFALAQAILDVEGVEGESSFRALVHRAGPSEAP